MLIGDLTQTIAEMVMRSVDGSTAQWPIKPWAWHGYTGWEMAGVRWGKRPDGTIVQVHGAWAQTYCEEVDIIGYNVSRVDIALDIWHEKPQSEVITLHKVAALASREGRAERPYKVAYVNGFGDGDTLYLGSRSSETYVRIYDKEAESNGAEEYKRCVRYEVECKGDTAAAALERCRSGRYHSRSIAETVLWYLRRRGVDVRIDDLVPGQPRPNADTPRPNVDATLAWFRNQVRPSVVRALRAVDRESILEALGLTESP